MLEVFLTAREFSFTCSSIQDKTVNKEMYTDIILRLRDAIRRKSTEIWETRAGFSFTTMFQDTSRFFQGCFSKEQCDDAGTSPILSWPGSIWFLPVSLHEIGIDGTALLETNEIIKILTEELKRLSQNVYQECFQQLYSRCQKRIFAQGDYFVGK